MSLSTATAALAATAARLRSGILTADYAPVAIAELIEALAAERRAALAQIAQFEQASTPAAARNAYAQGWRDYAALAAAMLTARGYPDLAAELAEHQPDFARAGQAAHGAAA